MRTLKFRILNKDTGKLASDINIGDFGNEELQQELAKGNLEFMQWTGLTDKAGLEIYEGDIVNYKYESSEGTKMERTSTIEFANGSFGPLPYDDTDKPEYYTCKTYDFKVIGNIYEHPELLEKL